MSLEKLNYQVYATPALVNVSLKETETHLTHFHCTIKGILCQRDEAGKEHT